MDTSVSAVVAGNVQALRGERGWTLEQLSAVLRTLGYDGVGIGALSKIETGRRRNLTVDDLVMFARVFNVSVERLLLPARVPEVVVELLSSWASARDEVAQLLVARGEIDDELEQVGEFMEMRAAEIAAVLDDAEVAGDELVEHVRLRFGDTAAQSLALFLERS